METCFQRTYARTVVLSAYDPTAGNCWPTTPLEAPRHSKASLAHSLVGSSLLSPGSWCAQGFVFTLQETVSPGLWKFCNQIPLAFKVKVPGDSQSLCRIPRLGNLLWALDPSQQCENFFGIIALQFWGSFPGASMVGLPHCTSQVCCSQSPCPRGRPLLTHASAGDTQTLKGGSGSVSCVFPGSWCAQGFIWTLWASLAGLTLNMILPLLSSCWGFSSALGCGVSFFVGSSILLSMAVQWLVAVLEFLQEKMSTHPSTLPS